MPLVVWSYPRGEAVEAKGGQNSFYAIDYAARMAMEMGADIVKLNMPKIDPEKDKDAPAPYNEMEVDQAEAIRQCVESAGRALVVLSGGSKTDDETVLRNTREVMEAGGSGVIFGRNVWQREWNEALAIVEQIKETPARQRAPHPVVRPRRGASAPPPSGLGGGEADRGQHRQRCCWSPRRSSCGPGSAGRAPREGRGAAERLDGRVVRAVDGDTLEVRLDGGRSRRCG